MADLALLRTTPRRSSARQSLDWRRQGLAYLFLLPMLLIFALVTWYPILSTVLYSFQKVDITGVKGWVGLQNYARMLGNPLFFKTWQNTLQFIGLSLIFGALVPIVLALMINETRRLGPIFQLIIYLPTLIPVAVALLVWRLIYQPEGGALNSLLQAVGLPAQLWLQDPRLAKPAMIVIMTWLGAGGSTLIYLSALRAISSELLEAAELDGLSLLQRVWFIVLPLIRSRIQLMLVLQVITVAQVFTEPFILTNGGPANSTRTPVLEIYDTAFVRNDIGLASAWTVSLLVALSLFSLAAVWLRRDDGQA